MRLILFAIFNIIALNFISSRNLRPSDIFKGDNCGKNLNQKNKTKPINSKNDYILEDQKDLEKKIPTPEIQIISRRAPPVNIFDEIWRPQIFFKKGTGFEGISYHKDLGLNKGGYFMACCVIGGLVSDTQILNAHEWALKSNYITNDNFVNIPYKDFARKISEKYQTEYHSDWKIKGLVYSKIYWVVDSTGKEIFNSAGLGTRHY